MYRKLVLAGVAVASIVGTGTVAVAATGDSAPPPGTGQSQSVQHHPGLQAMKRVLHGEVVTRGPDGSYVTHQVARGVVAGVSPKLLVVHTADGTNQQFGIDDATTIRLRDNGVGRTGTIADVGVGDHVAVTGIGAGTPVARHVLDTGTRASGSD